MAAQQLNGFDITAALCCSTGMQDNGRDSSCVSRAVIDEIDARRGRGSASRYANDHPHYVTIPELILILSFAFFRALLVDDLAPLLLSCFYDAEQWPGHSMFSACDGSERWYGAADESYAFLENGNK